MLAELPREVQEMPILDINILTSVSDMAAGMTKAEILDTFSIDEEEFSADESIYFNEFYSYGKGMAIHRVVNNLVESTKGKAGIPAALAYLRRFATEFEGEVEGDTSGSFSFNFGPDK